MLTGVEIGMPAPLMSTLLRRNWSRLLLMTRLPARSVAMAVTV